jgi:hypothetical protein
MATAETQPGGQRGRLMTIYLPLGFSLNAPTQGVTVHQQEFQNVSS